MSEERLIEEGLTVSQEEGVEAIDDETKEKCKARLLELQEERAEVEELGNYEKKEEIDEEVEGIKEYLAGSLNIKKQPRKLNQTTEKARKSIGKAINESIEHITSLHEELGSHFDKYVHRGYFLSYEPPSPIDWVTN